MEAIGLLLCSGHSLRMGFDKLTAPLGGLCAMERSALLLKKGGCDRLVVTVSAENRDFARSLRWPLPVLFCEGGRERRDSVWQALCACGAGEEDIVLIHDGDRCFMPPAVVAACLRSARETGSGVAALKVTDTILKVEQTAVAPVDRSTLYRTQTPQCFRFGQIREAYAYADRAGATDDATLYAARFNRVSLVEGSEEGRKLTTPADWQWAKNKVRRPRYGTGFDTHVLTEGRRLILGGVDIPFEKGLLGHSDADVLLHAVMDALLGAAGLGDIGKNFPDRDPAYKDISSRLLLRRVKDMLKEKDMEISHIDATVIAQRPKLNPHFPLMQAYMAGDLEIPADRISLKATTTEGMGDEGRGLCISAQAAAVVLG